MKKIEEEHWKPARYIKGDNGSALDFTGKYEVSSLGRVRSLNYHRTGKTKVLSQCTHECTDGTIYYQVLLRKGNNRHLLQVHRLVLSSFDPEGFRPGLIVNHKVERSPFVCDNSSANLEWTTQKDNVNTEHRRTLLSKSQTNHPSKSKKVCVTDLTTGKTTVYPSAKEAGRSLGINPKIPAMCINQNKGFYKKLGLHFEYV